METLNNYIHSNYYSLLSINILFENRNTTENLTGQEGFRKDVKIFQMNGLEALNLEFSEPTEFVV